jgi:hypothetical protein
MKKFAIALAIVLGFSAITKLSVPFLSAGVSYAQETSGDEESFPVEMDNDGEDN